MFPKSSFCHTQDKNLNEDETQILPTMDKWEYIQHDTGVRYEGFATQMKIGIGMDLNWKWLEIGMELEIEKDWNWNWNGTICGEN